MNTGKTIHQKIEGHPLQLWKGVDGSFPKPGELIEIHGHSSLTMQDRRTLNLLMTNAWPRITEEIEHSILKSVLRGGHTSNDRLGETLERLMRTIVTVKVTRDGKPTDLRVQLLGPTYENRDDAGKLYYRFLPEMISIISMSDHWARLQAQVMLALSSKYAIALYEMIQKRAGLKHKYQDDFSMEALRSILGVPKDTLVRWPDLRRFAIEPAVREVSALSSCHVRIEPIKHGQQTTGVRMAWWPKDEAGLKATYKEIERHKTGRKTRITGKVGKATHGQEDLELKL